MKAIVDTSVVAYFLYLTRRPEALTG